MINKPTINVVLITPEIPQNTGNIIRLCANIGARLHLVEPLGFRLDDKGLRRASLDYLDLTDVVCHPSIESFWKSVDNRRIYGAIPNGQVLYNSPRYRFGDTILFGPESSGLPSQIVDKLQTNNRVRIPMRPSNRSLNISNAVAIIAFEMWRQMNFNGALDQLTQGPTSV